MSEGHPSPSDVRRDATSRLIADTARSNPLAIGQGAAFMQD